MPRESWGRGRVVDLSGLTALADERLLLLAAATVLAALARGFTGFGAGMIFIPVASALYEPKVAVVLLFVIDGLVTAPILVPAFRRCTWREVLPLAVGASLTLPLGVMLLVVADPIALRWFLSITILAIVVVMATGWRYTRRASVPVAAGIGGIAGFAGGLANLYGPPIILFWLAGQSAAATVRSNLFAFFGLISLMAGASYWWKDLFTADVLMLAAILVPIYAAPVIAGATLFRSASEDQFRTVALVLCGVIAVASMPLWHGP